MNGQGWMVDKATWPSGKGLVKKYWGGGVGWSREGVGHLFLNPW